jgi:lambda family phage tail tape measure protein
MVPVLSDAIAKLEELNAQERKLIEAGQGEGNIEAYKKREAMLSNLYQTRANFGKALDEIQGDGALSTLKEGFLGVTEAWREAATNMRSVGADLAQSMSSNFSSAFDSFITRSKTAGEAFRDFGLGLIKTAAEVMANKAFQAILGQVIGAVVGAAGSSTTATSYGRTTYVETSNPGYNESLFMASGGVVSGGSGVRDDVPAMLTGGEGVVTRTGMSLLGEQGLYALNQGRMPRFADGGPVGSIPKVNVNAGGGDAFHINVTVNDNSSGNRVEDLSATTSAKRANEMARLIKAKVLEVIDEQRRTGGRFSKSATV